MNESEQRWPRDGSQTGPGIVTHRSARIWARCRSAGNHTLTLRRQSAEDSPSIEIRWATSEQDKLYDTQSFVVPDDFAQLEDLVAASTYHYEVRDDAGLIGRGRFHTAPEPTAARPYAGESFSIALLSCHQPFRPNGQIDAEAKKALDRLPEVLESRGVRRVICLGDQMYADFPQGKSLYDAAHFSKVGPPGAESLFDCSSSQVCQLFRDRFSDSFSLGGFSQTLANWSTTMICDDHEIVDNFGSDPEHSTPRWENIREGALQAVFDYEGLRQQPREASRPESMHFSWEYGPVSIFVMDLRSQRTADDDELSFFSDSQLKELEQYLHDQTHAPIFLLGLGIPLAFAPSALVKLGIAITGEGSDVAERWWNEKADRSRKQLTSLLERHIAHHPEQIMVLVSGDVHAGSVSGVHIGSQRAYQLISSAVTNHENALTRAVAQSLPHLGSWEKDNLRWSLLENEIKGSNPYSGLNIGLLTVTPQENSRYPELRLEIIGLAEPDGAKVVYRSSPLTSDPDNLMA